MGGVGIVGAEAGMELEAGLGGVGPEVVEFEGTKVFPC